MSESKREINRRENKLVTIEKELHLDLNRGTEDRVVHSEENMRSR